MKIVKNALVGVFAVTILVFNNLAFSDAADGTFSWTHTTLGASAKITKIEGTTAKMQFQLNNNTEVICGINGGADYYLDFATHAIGKQVYSLLLAASIAQKEVDIYYKCENQAAVIQHAIMIP